MDNTNYNELPFEKIVNQNSANARQKYEEAFQRSTNNQKRQYAKEKKRKNKLKLNRAITSIALIATIAISAGITHQITSTHIENNNVVISTSTVSDSIDEKIAQYEKNMNMYSDSENSIETYINRNNNEATVSYTQTNIDNLSKHLIEAAKKSESETRCVIIAAHNIINEPYRNDVIGKALAEANANQEDNSSYNIPSTTKEFLENNGYENWEDYKLNERDNIKNLKAAEEYVGGKNR